jgi:hypothetical protein
MMMQTRELSWPLVQEVPTLRSRYTTKSLPGDLKALEVSFKVGEERLLFRASDTLS